MKILSLAVILFLLVIPLSLAALSDDLVLYYKMDGVGATVTNEVGNDGTMSDASDFTRNTEIFRSGRGGNGNIECNMDSTEYIETSISPFGGSNTATMCFYWSMLDNTDWAVFVGQSAAVDQTTNMNIFNDGNVKFKIDATWYTVVADTVGLDHHFCVVQNGTSWYRFLNGSLQGVNIETPAVNGNLRVFNTQASMNLCADDFKIDEFAVWNRSLTEAEIKEVFLANGTYPFPTAAPPPTSNISTTGNILFRNETDYIFKSTMREGEDFFVYVNYTWDLNNSPIISGECNVSLHQALTSNDAYDTNFTICGSGCDYERFTDNFTLLTTNALNDSVHFDGCHEATTTGTFDVSIGCSAGTSTFTINASQLVSCSAGNTKIFLKSDVCIAQSTVNASVFYPGINNKRKRIEKLDLDREFSQIDIEMTYNAALQLYNNTNSFEYYEHGAKTIDANCTHPSGSSFLNISETLTIENRIPIVTIDSVIINGTSIQLNQSSNNFIEYINGTWTFNIVVEDDDFINGSVQIRNISNDVIRSYVLPGSVIAFGDDFKVFSDQPFNITVMAQDDMGALGNASIQFNATDINDPWAVGIDNASIVNGSIHTWNVMFYDENFFGFSVVCSGGSSFTANVTGLNVQSYNYTNSTQIVSNTTCVWRYCDGHTNDYLNYKWDMVADGNILEFRVNNYRKILLESIDDVEKYSWKEQEDRVKFDVKMVDNGWHTFYYHSKMPEYLPSNYYSAWIGDWLLGTWFDLNPYETQVFKVNSTTWEIRVFSEDKHFQFDSIGELNCVEQEQFIEAESTPFINPNVLRIAECPTDRDGIIGLLIGFVIYMSIVIFNAVHLRIPALQAFFGIGFLYFSVYYWACSMIVGVSLGVFGLAMLISSAEMITGIGNRSPK